MYIADHALQMPDRPAVVMATTGDTLTYAQLEARANQFARLLRQKGLLPGEHIALLMENNVRFFELILGASRIGLYYTPISSHLTPSEIAYIVNDSTSRVVVTTSKLLDVAKAAESSCPDVGGWYTVGVSAPPSPFEPYEDLVAGQVTRPLPDETLGMAMMYSSGTTGRPKGVLRPLPDLAPRESTDAARMGKGLMKFRAGMKLLSVAPLYHAAPHAAVAAALQLGAQTVVMDRFEPGECLRLIERYRITHVQMVPTMFIRLLKLPEAVRGAYDLSSLEAVVHSAAPCPVAIKEAMIEWLGPIVYEYYGATESYGFTRCNSQEWLTHKGTVGRAVLGTIHILDDSGNSLSPGEIGNIWFSGGSSFTYFGRDEAGDAQAGSRRAETVGDVGWMDEDGYLYLTDRKSFMIVSGGVNVYPQEVEDVLSAHESVADVAVIGVPDDDLGERVQAVIVLAPEYSPGPETETALIEYCRQSLAGFKCPRSVDFVAALPRLESGKLAKHRIREAYWGDRPSPAFHLGESEGMPA